ncbi:N-acetyltransferase family protein [Paenibacillus solani]|uniref:GNAT family N-acetyltransferase n=1 Tax=Paenibacillus solani TaxID=1705565 RepID=UPI003D2D79EE
MIGSNVDYRWAVGNDAQALVTLNDEFNGVGITEEEVRKNLSNPKELVALALIEEYPVGFACAQIYRSICYPDPYAELTELYIRHDARRKGIATMLVRFIEEELIRQGVKSVKVLTGKKNGAAIKTYERLSYFKDDEQLLQKTFMS